MVVVVTDLTSTEASSVTFRGKKMLILFFKKKKKLDRMRRFVDVLGN